VKDKWSPKQLIKNGVNQEKSGWNFLFPINDAVGFSKNKQKKRATTFFVLTFFAKQ
jgi:hypothetical protein